MTDMPMTGCQCGCSDAMTPPPSREQELQALREQKERIDERLAELRQQQS